jgi:hypothetical protein
MLLIAPWPISPGTVIAMLSQAGDPLEPPMPGFARRISG